MFEGGAVEGLDDEEALLVYEDEGAELGYDDEDAIVDYLLAESLVVGITSSKPRGRG